MDLTLTIPLLVGYFLLLFVISWWTGRDADEQTFFTANRNSPWYLVAFGMIGATLSGVTFISVPGAVGTGQWGYLQFVMGNLLGYVIISFVLLPLYYRLNLTSIYGFLGQRFGEGAYKSGAILFLISRLIGASLRMYLVALVIQIVIGNELGIPFAVTVAVSIALIYLYTFRGGIKTVVWTDTLQTAFMLLGAGITVYVISQRLGLGPGELVETLQQSDYSQVFFWDWKEGNHFFKQLFSGMFISIVMVGLDQDMMQKNLTCRTLQDAQKNVLWFSAVFFLSNILFLGLGSLLYLYGEQSGVLQAFETVPPFLAECKLFISNAEGTLKDCFTTTDGLFPAIAKDHLGICAGISFILAVIAAAYSSADSALTALTTSCCVDLLKFEQRTDQDRKRILRQRVHMGFALALFLVILIFEALNDDSVVWAIFRAAGYTYGPLLGLFVMGMYTKLKIRDQWIPLVCVICPILTYVIQWVSPMVLGYTFGFEILILNGVLTCLGLLLIRE
ncbi:MAG: sodium:solute symporter [Bacteroidota bacterium]